MQKSKELLNKFLPRNIIAHWTTFWPFVLIPIEDDFYYETLQFIWSILRVMLYLNLYLNLLICYFC